MVLNGTLTGTVQTELGNVIWANSAAMKKEKLRNHIQEINKGLQALVHLPKTSRLNEMLKE
jgi:hypothetical protein